jgi:sporulation protein YlmC with PRC-barrel domain
MFSIADVQTLRDGNVLDSDGDKIGSVEEIYLDQETEKPEWAVVNTGGRFQAHDGPAR